MFLSPQNYVRDTASLLALNIPMGDPKFWPHIPVSA